MKRHRTKSGRVSNTVSAPIPLGIGILPPTHPSVRSQEAPLNPGILGSNRTGTIDWIIAHVIELNPQSTSPIQRLGWLKALAP